LPEAHIEVFEDGGEIDVTELKFSGTVEAEAIKIDASGFNMNKTQINNGNNDDSSKEWSVTYLPLSSFVTKKSISKSGANAPSSTPTHPLQIRSVEISNQNSKTQTWMGTVWLPKTASAATLGDTVDSLGTVFNFSTLTIPTQSASKYLQSRPVKPTATSATHSNA